MDMKRFYLKRAPANAPAPHEPMSEKEKLIKDIRDFIGENGVVPMEHGYRPELNATAFDYNGMVLYKLIGREHRTRIEYAEMEERMLTRVILELFRYYNYCRLYA